MAKTLGIVLKREHPAAHEAFEHVVRASTAGRFITVEGPQTPLPEKLERVSVDEFETESDVVVVLGGDGTLIHAASLLRTQIKPVLGVNLGRLGFMAAFAVDELDRALPAAFAGELPHVDRLRLDAKVCRNGRVMLERRILNDAALTPAGMARLSQYQIFQGQQLVTSLRGDGVVVATPTGSTAYSMAAGGSILTPGLDAIAITPISPHSLTQRPLVVSTELPIRIIVSGQREVHATLDGQVGVEARPGDSLQLELAPVPMRLLQAPWRDYFQTLREKLKWGEPLVDGPRGTH
ncbi:MAG: NAD(+)/NADH kinase [Myxococcota bacterium]